MTTAFGLRILLNGSSDGVGGGTDAAVDGLVVVDVDDDDVDVAFGFFACSAAAAAACSLIQPTSN